MRAAFTPHLEVTGRAIFPQESAARSLPTDAAAAEFQPAQAAAELTAAKSALARVEKVASDLLSFALANAEEQGAATGETPVISYREAQRIAAELREIARPVVTLELGGPTCSTVQYRIRGLLCAE